MKDTTHATNPRNLFLLAFSLVVVRLGCGVGLEQLVCQSGARRRIAVRGRPVRCRNRLSLLQRDRYPVRLLYIEYSVHSTYARYSPGNKKTILSRMVFFLYE